MFGNGGNKRSKKTGGSMPKKQKKGIEYYVLEGDYGGQIYLTVPVSQVPEAKVLAALAVIDAIEWFGNGGDDRNIQKGRPGKVTGGGMGGGRFERSLWLHSNITPSLSAWARDYLLGNSPLPSPETMMRWFVTEDMKSRFFPKRWILKGMRKAFIRAHRRLQNKESIFCHRLPA